MAVVTVVMVMVVVGRIRRGAPPQEVARFDNGALVAYAQCFGVSQFSVKHMDSVRHIGYQTVTFVD
jgi:hypothetical protein